MKRTFDVVISFLLLAVSLPLWVLIAASIRSTSHGPVFQQFSQPGRGGKAFGLLKFRTTHITAGIDGEFAQTIVGRVLRRLGLDELPQLLNVVSGNMSLVGPRPISALDFDRMESWQKRRYLVSPGVTGLWQISGRRDNDLAEMVRLDLYYVQRWSLFGDLEILLKTIPVTLSGRQAVLLPYDADNTSLQVQS
jgi:lipopolysaccharide/colanic/teichoic acid biosynthesis glycosyltransferase